MRFFGPSPPTMAILMANQASFDPLYGFFVGICACN